MAVQTETTLNIMYGADIADAVGLSNTLNAYLSEEIEDYIYCGCYNNVLGGNMYVYDDTGGSYDVWNKLYDKFMPYETDAVTGTYMEMLPGGGSYTADSRGRYVGTIWITDIDNHGYDNNITQNNASHYKIITEWDAKNYYVNHRGLFSQVDGYGATDWSDQNAGLYNYDFSDEELHYVYDDHGTERDIILYGTLSVFPYTVYVDPGSSLLYIVKMSTSLLTPGFRCHISPTWNGGYSLLNFSGNNAAQNSLCVSYNNLNFGSSFTDVGLDSYNWLYPTSHVDYRYSKTDKKFVSKTYFTVYEFQVSYYFTEVTELLWLFAAGGLKFKVDGTMYKPLISDNVVYGYTDDMTAESEIDSYTGSNKHDIPVTPPTPPTPPIEGDDVDDMTVDPLFGLSSDAGFAAYWLITASDLASLHTWLTSTTFPDGYDPYDYIISLIQFPLKLSPGWCLAGTSGNIYIGSKDTGITASLIGTEQTWKGLGTFNVPRLNSNFLDFDPYSQYEVYIPCCGWVTVPDIVAGHEISVRINYDLTDASIIGNVYVNINGDWLLIASKSGMMGRQTVISGEAQGVKSAQITSALLSAGTGALNVATGAISGNAVAAVSGGYNIVAGLTQANIASNSSYVRTIGSTGGRSLLCQYDKCYLKITTTEIYVPDNYGHTIGYICNKKGSVSDFSGFTVFSNVDTSGISGATARERELIKRYLETGIIINPPSN